MSSERLSEGDRVRWNTSQGETTGRVVQVATSDVEIGGEHLRASDDDPRYIVESDKSGKHAGHRREALSKIDD